MIALLAVCFVLASVAGALGGYALTRGPLDELAERRDGVVQYGTGADHAHFDRLLQEVHEVVASQKALVYAAARQGINLEEGA